MDEERKWWKAGEDGNTPNGMSAEDFDPGLTEDQIESLNLEKTVFGGSESPAELANKILEDAAPAAAQGIVSLATSRNVNERVRLTASQYIIDRVCGKSGDSGTTGKDPWSDIFAAVTREEAEV